MEIFIIWVFFAVVIGWWADTRGRNWGLFSLLSLVFSPILAGIVLLVTKNLAQEKIDDAARLVEELRREQQRREDHEKQLESIKVLAKGPTTAGGSVADELVKLASLRDAGVLTDAEFQAQKSTLLGSATTV